MKVEFELSQQTLLIMSDVNDGVTAGLQWSFFSSLYKYDTDIYLIFLVNYCQIFFYNLFAIAAFNLN